MKATVTSKGQITIPQAIRAKANIVAGSQLDFQIQDDHTIIVHLITHDVTDLKGLIKSKGQKAPTLEDMKNAISIGSTRSFAKKNQKKRT